MAGEKERTGALPGELHQWIEQRAADSERSPTEILSRAVMAYRLLEEGDPTESLAAEVSALSDRVDSIETASTAPSDELRSEIESLETQLSSDIEDLQRRIVDVLKEAKAKAKKSHEHPELKTEIQELSEAVDAVEETVSTLGIEQETLEQEMQSLDETVTSGFANYRTILEALDQTTVDLADKTSILARAVISLRSRTEMIERQYAIKQLTDDFKQEANQKRIETGNCQECGEPVVIALLSLPRCPHCESRFSGIEPGWRFVGRATLQTETQPALEGEIAAIVDDRSAATGEIDRLARDDTPTSVLEDEPSTENEPIQESAHGDEKTVSEPATKHGGN